MDNFVWIGWCVLGGILIVAEVFTSGFVLLWFGIGALAAALAGDAGDRQLRGAVSDFCHRLRWSDRSFAHDLCQLLFPRNHR